MKILPNPHSNHLNEAFQANQMRFAFVVESGDDYIPVHDWCMCRDYFNDILFCNYHPTVRNQFSQYGMNYNATANPINKEKVLFGIRFVNANDRNIFISNLNLINQVESWTNLTPTKYIETQNSNEIVLIADKFWQEKTILFNIYTLLIKLCTQDIKLKTWTNIAKITIRGYNLSEINYINTLTINNFQKVLQNLREFATMHCKYIDGTNSLDELGFTYIHSYRGIVSAHNYAQCPQYPTSKEPFVQTYLKITKQQQLNKDFFVCQDDAKLAT